MKLVSLFSGAGGMDLGLEAAGFETCITVDKDKKSCQTIRNNTNSFKSLDSNSVINEDIHKIIEYNAENPSEAIMEVANLEPKEPSILAAGPPCPPFSKSAYWKSGDTERLDDERASTLQAFTQVLRDTLPNVYILENVPGITYKNKDEAIAFLRKEIDNISKNNDGVEYSFSCEVLNSANFGVPQKRKRAFIIGSRDGTDFRFDEISRSHGEDSALKKEWHSEERVTAWDAIGDLDGAGKNGELTGKWEGLLPSIPEGENYQYHTERGGGESIFGWRTRYWNFLLKLAKDLPSWTIQANPGSGTGPYHWKNRRLTVDEMCRLQTFPDDYDISGGYRKGHWQVGNAVPPLLAEMIGRTIRRQLFGEDSFKKSPPKYRIEKCDYTPPAETYSKEIPEEYREHIDSHDPHPGPGKGPMYQD